MKKLFILVLLPVIMLTGCNSQNPVKVNEDGIVLNYGEEIKDSDVILNLAQLQDEKIEYEYNKTLLNENQPLKVKVTVDGKTYTSETTIRLIENNMLKVEYDGPFIIKKGTDFNLYEHLKVSEVVEEKIVYLPNEKDKTDKLGYWYCNIEGKTFDDENSASENMINSIDTSKYGMYKITVFGESTKVEGAFEEETLYLMVSD